jgi:phage-related protein
MKLILKAAALAALSLTAACEVKVDQNLASRVDNHADAFENGIEGLAAGAENAVEGAGAAIESGADRIGNGVNVDVKMDGNDADANTADANAQ